MSNSLAAQILSSDDRKSEVIEIKEWSGSFIVKELTAAKREAFEVAYQKNPADALKGLKTSIVINCLHDMDGNQVFKPEHAKDLLLKSASIIDRIFTVSQKLSGIDGEAVEAEEKNS